MNKKRKLFTFLISLIVAFVLWGYVITVEKPDSEATYKVEVAISDDDIAFLPPQNNADKNHL